jgi:hypothetical protein
LHDRFAPFLATNVAVFNREGHYCMIVSRHYSQRTLPFSIEKGTIA